MPLTQQQIKRIEDEAELLPCPFCGGEAVIEQTGRNKLKLKCQKCCMKLEQKTIRHSLDWLKGKMIESWNKRVYAEKCNSLLDALKEIAEPKYPESVFTPITDEDFNSIKNYCEQILYIPIDRLSGHCGRILQQPSIDIATKAIKEHSK